MEVAALSRAITDPGRILGHLAQRVDSLDARLTREAGLVLDDASERIVTLSARLARLSPTLTLKASGERLKTLSLRMDHAMTRRLSGAAERIGLAAGTLSAVSPLATLSRGYSIARRLPGRSLVRDSRELAPGDRLEVTFASGCALCAVEETREESESLTAPPRSV